METRAKGAHRVFRALPGILRDPLVHFVVLGTALFLIWPFIADRVAPSPNEIVISQGELQRAIEVFHKTHLRAPDPPELDALVEDEVRAEVYYREGLALGLDRDDEIIRRRIAQKVQFMTQDLIHEDKPSDAELQRFLDLHRAEFGAEPQIAFSQVYLNPDRHRDGMESHAARLLARLNARDGRLDYAADSDPLPVPNDFELTPLPTIATVFGDEFSKALAAQPSGRWVGPVRSGFGAHLVLLRDRREGAAPDLAHIRDVVLRKWQATRREEENRAVYLRMRAGYVVKVEALPPAVGSAP